VLDSYDDSTFTTQTRRYAFHSTFDDHSYGGNLTTTYYSDFFQQLKLAVLYKKNVHKEQGNYDAPFKKYEADNITIGIEDELTFGKFRTVIGASYDRVNPVYVDGGEVPEDISTYNGHFGLSYNLNETANLRFNLSRKSRFPTLKELYAEAGGRFIANYDLSTEHSVNTELGIRVNSFENLEIDGAVFYNNVTDLIQVKFLPQSQRQFQNIGKVVFLGFETGMSWKSSDVSANVNYTFLNATNESDDAETDKLEYRPKHRFNLLGTYFWDYGIEITAEARLLADRYGINPNTRDFEEMDNYTLFNAKIAKRIFNNYHVFLRVNNITNEYYETQYGFPQPGREIIFGAKASF
jgi:iron complex outermembrane receptor protein